ncbi:hypothetical protein [Streptomyces collinus]|uniref:Uncharacterized protein n=1 Tax=Streptomyces collinus (strain DSM 40733 / Tue 365) TaxID=1214242 RepID=S5VSZ2_STRC3|nr:hypothetical protein [Streptomyces collinus]AGS73957.1 hypothetical protein B446_35993 [Streptomyces collinus Tu 365]
MSAEATPNTGEVQRYVKGLGRAASFVAGLVVLAFAADCIPPWPFVTEDGSPAKLRRLGMLRCPACGLMSNREHRRLCRGPWRAGEDVST